MVTKRRASTGSGSDRNVRAGRSASEDARRQGEDRRPSVAGRRRADGDSARSQRTARKWPKVVLLSGLGVIIAVFGLLAWQRWFRYDDALDVQGTWQTADAKVAIEIRDGLIHIADDVAYRYELDPQAKTLALSFGEYTGGGHYWFSFDRQTLVFVDGQGGGTAELFEDVSWSWGEVLAFFQGSSPVLPSGENMVVLKRVAEGVS